MVAQKIFELKVVPLREDMTKCVRELTTLWITCAFIVLVLIFTCLLFQLESRSPEDPSTTFIPPNTSTTKRPPPTTVATEIPSSSSTETAASSSSTESPVPSECNYTHCARDCCSLELMTSKVVCQSCVDEVAASEALNHLKKTCVSEASFKLKCESFWSIDCSSSFLPQLCTKWDLEFEQSKFTSNSLAPNWLNISTQVSALRFHFKSSLIENIQPGAFTSKIFAETESLDLSNVLLSKLESDNFGGLTSLRTLKIRSTILTTIAKDAFSKILNLMHLEIRGGWNLSTKLSTSNGVTYPNLEYIDFTETDYIATILKDSFTSVPKLKHLNVSGTGLRSIESGAFNGLNHLVEIDLSRNSISTVNGEIFLDIVQRAGAQIDLSVNPWQCTCFLKELKRLMAEQDTATAFVNKDSSRCVKVLFPLIVYGSSIISTRLVTVPGC